MTLKNFIKENRDEIDRCIWNFTSHRPSNDAERREWILNDEGLYRWAKREGCRI